MDGLGGDDLLIGAPGNDTFAFGADFGKDRIDGFDPTEDVIAFDAALFTHFDEVMDATADDGLGNAVITCDPDGTITLTGVGKAELLANPGAFDFV